MDIHNRSVQNLFTDERIVVVARRIIPLSIKDFHAPFLFVYVVRISRSPESIRSTGGHHHSIHPVQRMKTVVPAPAAIECSISCRSNEGARCLNICNISDTWCDHLEHCPHSIKGRFFSWHVLTSIIQIHNNSSQLAPCVQYSQPWPHTSTVFVGAVEGRWTWINLDARALSTYPHVSLMSRTADCQKETMVVLFSIDVCLSSEHNLHQWSFAMKKSLKFWRTYKVQLSFIFMYKNWSPNISDRIGHPVHDLLCPKTGVSGWTRNLPY